MAPQTQQMPSLMETVESPDPSGSGGDGDGKGPKRSFRESLSNAFGGSLGKVLLGLIVVGGIGFAIFRGAEFSQQSAPNYPVFRMMSPETGELRWVEWRPNKPTPEGFHPVEYCFENACGPAGGTPVILNSYLDIEGQTYCPVCGAEVYGHNGRPEEYIGVTPKDQR